MENYYIIGGLFLVVIIIILLLIKDSKKRRYQAAVKRALEDELIMDEEQAELEALKIKLKISDATADAAYRNEASLIIRKYMNGYLEDGLLSPDEDKELEQIALRFGMSIDVKTHQELNKYRLFWNIETNGMPVIASGAFLQKNEVAHYECRANWMELRTVIKNIYYSGYTYRLRIVKGLYYRVGSIKPAVDKRDEMTLIDQGDLLLTNKRLIFFGCKGNKSIPLKSVVDFEVFKNGIEIHKPTGRIPFLQMNNVEVFAFILNKAVQAY